MSGKDDFDFPEIDLKDFAMPDWDLKDFEFPESCYKSERSALRSRVRGILEAELDADTFSRVWTKIEAVICHE